MHECNNPRSKRQRMLAPNEMNSKDSSFNGCPTISNTNTERFKDTRPSVRVKDDNVERTNLLSTDPQTKQRMLTPDKLDSKDCLIDKSPTITETNDESFEATRPVIRGSRIQIGCSFTDALTHDYILIDKTLFIYAILNSNCRAVLILAPRRMGKSFNLAILQEFFSPCDEYGKIRDPAKRLNGLKIMDPEIRPKVQEFMGKHPVVRLNLDRKKVFKSLDDVKDCFRDAVYECHLEHLYILEMDDPKLFELVEKGREKWMLDTNLDTSLKTLTQRLCEHHSRECVFIVDGYDTMLTQIAKSIVKDTTEKEIKELSELLDSATLFILGTLDTVIKDNNKNVRFAVIAGISDVASGAESEPLNDVDRYRFLRNSEFFQFFGLLENEYNDLMDKFKKNDDRLEEAKKTYNGYRFLNGNTEYRIYNPWAAFKFAKTSKNTVPPHAWCETGTIGLTSNVCKYETVRDVIFNLIQGKSVTFGLARVITYADLINLSKMCESSLRNSTLHTELYYTHLLNQGYLTITETSQNQDVVTCEIPNDEIRAEFVKFLKQHAENEYGIDVTKFPECSKLIFQLLELLENNDLDITKYDSILQTLHGILKDIYNVNEEKTNMNEFVINSVSYFIGNELTKNVNSNVDCQLYCNDGINKGFLDVAYNYKKNTIIFENKLNDTVETAIKQILDRNYRSPYADNKFILIGTTMERTKSNSFKMGYLVNSVNVAELKTFE